MTELRFYIIWSPQTCRWEAPSMQVEITMLLVSNASKNRTEKVIQAYTVFFKCTASPHGLYNSSSSTTFALSLTPICKLSPAIFLDCGSFADLCLASLPTIRCALFCAMFLRRNAAASMTCLDWPELNSDEPWLTPAYKQHAQPITAGARDTLFLPWTWSSALNVLLWSPYVIGRPYIFSSCDFFLSSFYLSFFSSPNLSGRRLDVYHTLAQGVALVRI